MECFACDQEAAQRCFRCGKSYCSDHGSASTEHTATLCDDCLDPASATPSSAVFRAAVFGLFAVSVLALWLIVRPPGLPGESSSVKPLPTVAETQAPSPSGSAKPSASVTPKPSATAKPTAKPTAAPTPVGPLEYTVVENDTWLGIAAAFDVDAEQLAAFNGKTTDDFIQPGEVLLIPQ